MMAEENEESLVADESLFTSSEVGSGGCQRGPGGLGCLVLLFTMALLDALGMVMAIAGRRYSHIVAMLGLAGFACGALVGAYVSVKIMKQPWWSSSRWAIYGLIGICVPTCILAALFLTRR